MSDAEPQTDKFIDRCLRGEVVPEQIDQFVNEWYSRHCPIDLFDYLGMEWEEYLVWVNDPDLLPLILIAHREQCSLAEVLARQAAARTH